MESKQRPKVTKKIAGKRRWYFRPSRVKLSTVLRNITFFENWTYSRRDRNKIISITKKNVKDLILVTLVELKENNYKYKRLSILDGWIIYKWLRLKRLNFSNFDKEKIYIFSNPLLRPNNNTAVQDYYFFCLEQDREFPQIWKWKIISRTYINGGQGNYKVLCLPVGI